MKEGSKTKEKIEIVDEVKEVKEEKEESKEKSFLEDLQRVQADFENYIKRVEKEKGLLKLHAKSELLLKLIEVKEDFERALRNLEETSGIEMIYSKVKKILDEEDVKEIEAVGKEFNHVFHDIVKIIEGAENKVVEEVRKGYLIGDKVLRTSKVIIGKGETKIDEDNKNE